MLLFETDYFVKQKQKIQKLFFQARMSGRQKRARTRLLEVPSHDVRQLAGKQVVLRSTV